MPRKLNIKIGDKVGILEVINIIKTKGYKTSVEVKCKCGNIKTITSHSIVKDNQTSSCGCLQKRAIKKSNTTHGLRNHPLYHIRSSMLSRCYKSQNKSYKDYGKRGITVCDEWRDDFKKFYDWAMANGWEKGLTIERIDNNGNYYPENCEWIEKGKQSNNRRSNHLLTAFGETKTMMDWSKDNRCVVNYFTLAGRINNLGWEIEKSILTTCGK